MELQWGSTSVHDSVMSEVLYIIHIKSVIPMKLVRLVKMCLKEAYI
jgi:hypothetical protein